MVRWSSSHAAMAERICGFDWGGGSLGDASLWPASLPTVIDLIPESPLPQTVLWGQELIQIYNDSYALIMGAKHPSGFAQPTSECWPEVWPFNRSHYEAVFNGRSVSIDDQYLPLERNGVAEPTWFDLTYSPLRDDAGIDAGVLVTTIEITGRNQAEAALRESEEGFGAKLPHAAASCAVGHLLCGAAEQSGLYTTVHASAAHRHDFPASRLRVDRAPPTRALK